MTEFTRDELEALQASLRLGRRDNFSPVLAAVALMLVGLHNHRDWTDLACIVWGSGQFAYFIVRHLHDRDIHKRAKAIIQSKRLGPTK